MLYSIRRFKKIEAKKGIKKKDTHRWAHRDESFHCTFDS